MAKGALWSEAEKQFIRDNYIWMTDAAISRAILKATGIYRSRVAVAFMRINTMGRGKPWSGEHPCAFRAEWDGEQRDTGRPDKCRLVRRWRMPPPTYHFVATKLVPTKDGLEYQFEKRNDKAFTFSDEVEENSEQERQQAGD